MTRGRGGNRLRCPCEVSSLRGNTCTRTGSEEVLLYHGGMVVPSLEREIGDKSAPLLLSPLVRALNVRHPSYWCIFGEVDSLLAVFNFKTQSICINTALLHFLIYHWRLSVYCPFLKQHNEPQALLLSLISRHSWISEHSTYKKPVSRLFIGLNTNYKRSMHNHCN